jgi:dihydropteroate synthase
MKKVQLMGILNVTPDSFYDQSRFFQSDSAIQRGLEICQEGADIIDIGGESTRPGADLISEEEELRRVIPVIKGLKTKVSIPISIDTLKPRVAKGAIEAGASWINDVGGMREPEMREVAVQHAVNVCVMHMEGTPKTMKVNPVYPDGIVDHLIRFFEAQIDLLVREGVQEKRIVIDPGIGFGKTIADNLEIIHNLPKLKTIGFPLLLGVSRKSFMSRLLNKSSNELLAATVAMNTAAILAGVDIIRVHDVQEHRDVINLLDNVRH